MSTLWWVLLGLIVFLIGAVPLSMLYEALRLKLQSEDCLRVHRVYNLSSLGLPDVLGCLHGSYDQGDFGTAGLLRWFNE